MDQPHKTQPLLKLQSGAAPKSAAEQKSLFHRLKAKLKNHYEFLLALFTWDFVGFYTFDSWVIADIRPDNLPEPNPLNITLVCGAFTLFLLYMVYTEFFRQRWPGLQKPVLIGTLLVLCSLLLLFHIGLVAILLIIYLVALVDYGLKPIQIIPVILLPLLIALWDAGASGQNHVLINGLAFTLYNIFAYMFAIRLHSEREARAQSANLLRELKATQTLLHDTAARDERLRIARDLHDTLGHHLTGLSIQLEVASHCNPEQAPEHIAKAQQITRLLLSDVRSSVSTLREQRRIDLATALRTLCSNLPKLDVNLDIEPNLTLCNAQLAGALFHTVQEALTNCMKHSAADRISIRLQHEPQGLRLRIQDNGNLKARQPTHTHQTGNGLKGMTERFAPFSGELEAGHNAEGFFIKVALPATESDLF